MRRSFEKPIKTAALVLCVCLLMASAVPALAVDLETPCTVEVKVSDELREDLLTANVALDLYQVAMAVPVEGDDGYSLKYLAPYEEPPRMEDPDTADWQGFAASVASIALSEGAPVVTGGKLEEEISETDGGTPLTPGLYLLIAHGAELEDYVRTSVNEDGEEVMLTAAQSEDYEYYFAPQLLSIPEPEREGADTEDGEEQSESMRGAGEVHRHDGQVWMYDLKVMLKMSRMPRFGSLEIIKTLDTYDAGEPATFVFDITATLDGSVVYSNVASLTFTAPGQQHTLLDRIPVGATVTVREVYSGVQYKTVTADTVTAVIRAGEAAQAEFENDYSGTPKTGHGITNSFTFDGSTWVWVQTVSDSQGGA